MKLFRIFKYWLGRPSIVLINGYYYVTCFHLDYFSRVYLYTAAGIVYKSQQYPGCEHFTTILAQKTLDMYRSQGKLNKHKNKVTVV